jgi:hypothetical protein
MTRDLRIGVTLLVMLGVLVFGLLVVGNLGEVRPELERTPVTDVVDGDEAPAERYGRDELRLVGWFAELDADCDGDDGGADAAVAWLQRDCPLRVLLAEQPSETVTQAELERDGVRLSAPLGNVFPSRAEPAGPNLQLEPLVFVGRFDDPAAADCLPERTERCRNTFVVTDYDGLVR